jgi:hypothetical protein
MNASRDLPPEPCQFVAANDDPNAPTWRDVLGLLVADLALAALVLAGWAAFGFGSLWLLGR